MIYEKIDNNLDIIMGKASYFKAPPGFSNKQEDIAEKI